jgi:arsenate reductase (thioredoxin)
VKLRVLFLCDANSIQSPMAEALLNGADSDHFVAMSAGIDRGEMHPVTVEVMREIGVDLEGRTTRRVQEVLELGFDYVITLSDRVRASCPKFQQGEVVHWQFDDPMVASDPAQQRRMFQSLRDQIAQRIRLFSLVQVRAAAAHAGGQRGVKAKRQLVHS